MNILYLCNKKTYDTKLCRVRFVSMTALSKLVHVKYWGTGWDSYNSDLCVQENIDKLEKKYDLIISYKPLEFKGISNVKIPLCIQYNEMFNKNSTLNEIINSGCKLVVCHHLNEAQEYSKMNIPNVKFVYIGHCAEKTIFKDYGYEKEYDVLIAGYINNVYPLRMRLYNILRMLKFKGYKCNIHPHPGYDLHDAHTNRYLKEMAVEISKSKIVLTCSSYFRYRLGKYVEIPMCGTALCGDVPKDGADDYNYVINIENMSNNEIMETIIEYLENSEKLNEKIEAGLDFTSNYTYEHYAERLLNEINVFLENK